MCTHLERALSRAFWEDFGDSVEIVKQVVQQRYGVAHFIGVGLEEK